MNFARRLCMLASMKSLLKAVAVVLVAKFLWSKWEERQAEAMGEGPIVEI